MSELAQDLRYTLRTLRKNGGFTGVIMLTLALGIGANTIIYSVVDGLVLNPFPFPEGDRLVAVGTQYPTLGQTDVNYIEHMSPAEYVDLRDESRSLERVVAWDMGNRLSALRKAQNYGNSSIRDVVDFACRLDNELAKLGACEVSCQAVRDSCRELKRTVSQALVSPAPMIVVEPGHHTLDGGPLHAAGA